jgi:hypothetical protein
MSRFSKEQLEALYSGAVAVRTLARKSYLRVPEGGIKTFLVSFKEGDIGKLSNKKIIELPPFTTVTCVKEPTLLLLADKELDTRGLRFVYVTARLDSGQVEGLMPKSVFLDYAFPAFHPIYTGVTYGGSKWAFKDSHQIVNFKEKARCTICNQSAGDHKLYETEDALASSRRLLHALYENKWAGGSPTMIGVLFAAFPDDGSRRIYAAYSGTLTIHDGAFQLIVATLNADDQTSKMRTWHFARTLLDDDPHRVWDGTNTLGLIRGFKGNETFKMSDLRCAAPKLIQAAHRDGGIPISMSEVWYQVEGTKNTDFIYGCTAESCNLCRMSVPPMLCYRDPTAVDDEIHSIF